MNLLIAVLVLIILVLLTKVKSMSTRAKIIRRHYRDYMSRIGSQVDQVNRDVSDMKDKLDRYGKED